VEETGFTAFAVLASCQKDSKRVIYYWWIIDI
jgi:hypothetical protein